MDSEIIRLREQNNYLRQIIAFQDNNTDGIFQQLSENIDDVFWLRTDNEMIYINPAFEKVWGIPCAEIYQNPQLFGDSIHPDDRKEVAEILNSDSFKKTGFFEYEYRIIRPDKQIRWVHAKSLPVINDKGEIIRHVGVARDITGQKKSQEETGLLAEMLDIAPNSITVHDATGKFLYANQKAFGIHGFTCEEFMSLNLQTLDVPASANLIEERIKAIKENGHATFEVEHYKKDGDKIPLEVFAKLVNWKGFPAMLSIATDISERKKAEKALTDSEEKFRTLVENANDIIYQVTPEGVFTYISPNWIEIFGYQLVEVIGANVDKFIHPDDLPRCMDFLNKVLTTGEKQSGVEYRVKHKNGTWRWHNTNGTPLKDENGTIVSFLGVSRDITEKTQARQNISLSETKYKAAFQTSPDAVNLNKLTGEYVEVNEGFTRLTGFTAEEVIGRFSSEIDIWSISEDRKKLLDGLQKDGIVENLETIFRAKDGSLIPALMSAKLINLNQEPHILSVTRDITERKKNEQQIVLQNIEYEALNEELQQTNAELFSAKEKAEESEQRFRSLIDNAPDGVAIVDENGKFVYGSPNAARLFGYNMDEVIGHSGDEYTHPDDLPVVFKTIETIINNPLQKPTVNYRFKRKNGEFRWIETTFTNLLSDKTIRGIILNFTDVTERKQIIEDLVIAKEKAEESDRLKTAFLQNMSHEIRTPMNAIMGFSELLLKNFENKEKLEKFVSIINQRCSDLLVIINDILDIAKIESGQLQLNEEKVNVRKLLLELEAIFNQQKLKVNKSKISIVFNNLYHSSDLYLVTDRSRLFQIFTNLLSNALKFTFQGKIEFGFTISSEQQFEFYVSDTGIGIRKEKHDVIFERFVQLNPATSPYSGGNGLGLAITKGLVKMLGGNIWVQSEIEIGSTFYFTIKTVPASTTHYLTDNNVEDIGPDCFGGKTILVVEDDEYNKTLIKEILDNPGLNLIFASNGEDSVQLCLTTPIDLVLMDIGLPDISGYEAIRQILSTNSNIKIIAQTAYASPTDKNKSLQSGCIDYISKPIKSSELIEIVKRHI